MACEKLQDSERRVRFHGIADLHLAPSEPALVGPQGVQHGCLGIDVEGRAELPGQVGKAKALQLKRLVVVVQVGVAGQNGMGHGRVVEAESAGDEAGAREAVGLRVSGSVARCAAAGSVGR